MNSVDKLLALFDRVESAEFFARDFGARLKQSEARVKELESEMTAKATPVTSARMCSEVDETVTLDIRPSVLSIHGCVCASWQGAACDCTVALLVKAKAELEDMRISRDAYAEMRDEARRDATQYFEELQAAQRDHVVRKRDLEKALAWSNGEGDRVVAARAEEREKIIAALTGDIRLGFPRAADLRAALGSKP